MESDPRSQPTRLGRESTQLSAAEEETAIARWQSRTDHTALAALVAAFRPLLIHIARRYATSGIPHDDLLQEAYVGFCMAVARFDQARGCRLSTYARWWVIAHVSAYVKRNRSIISTGLPCRSAPSPRGETLDTGALPRDVPFRVPADGGSAFQQVEIADPAISPEEAVITADSLARRRRLIQSAFANLSLREQQVLLARYRDGGARGLKEIGHLFGVTGERIRQVEVGALRKLREAAAVAIGDEVAEPS